MENLIPIFRETQVKLEGIWRAVGLSTAEQKAQVENLLGEIANVMNKKVDTETALLEAYKEEVNRLKEDIVIVIRRLDNSPNATANKIEAPVSERTPLVRELTWLRQKYEEYDTKRSVLQRDAEAQMLVLHAMMNELGEPIPANLQDIGFYLPGRREQFEKAIEVAKQKRTARIGEVKQIAQRLAVLLKELDMGDDSEFDRAIIRMNETAIGLSKDAMDSLLLREKELIKLKAERTEVLKQLGNLIQPLWNRLNVAMEERQLFFEKNSGLGEKTVRECQKEVDRLTEMKKVRMGDFIEAARAQLRALMEEARISLPERTRMQNQLLLKNIPANLIEENEKLLSQHEAEIKKLSTLLESLRPIIKNCSKYLTLCEERMEYDALVMDSTRLLNRKRGGPSLRDEELMRKRVQIELPKLIAALEKDVFDFEKRFLSGGEKLVLSDIFGTEESVLEIIQSTERNHQDQLQKDKEQKLKNKEVQMQKQNQPHVFLPTKALPTGSTATNNNSNRVPLAPKPKNNT